jgi:hypothetical protein
LYRSGYSGTTGCPTRFALRLAKIGLAGGIVSIAALALTGVAYAAGMDPAGACGGG